MTLISAIYGNVYPVIVSDRAISDPNTSGKVVLPTTGQKSREDTPVVEFRVKSIIIKDILCVAFSGLVSEIESAREDVIDYFLHRDVNKITFKEFLEQLDLNQYKNISVLYALGGAEFEDNKIMIAFSGGGWLQDHSKEKLNIFACGSGASEWIEHFVKFQSYMKPSDNRLVDCQQRALLASVTYISKEILSTDRLHEGWGGGFDIIYYANNRFQRYDQVAYVFLYVKEEEPEKINVISINHNTYINDNATVLNMYLDSKYDFKYTVVPQFRNNIMIDVDNLPLACMSSDVIACIFLAKKDGSEISLAIMLKEWDQDATPMFIAHKLEGDPVYVFKPIFAEKIKEGIKLFLN